MTGPPEPLPGSASNSEFKCAVVERCSRVWVISGLTLWCQCPLWSPKARSQVCLIGILELSSEEPGGGAERARERPLQSVHPTRRRCVGRSCGFSPSPSFRHPPFRTPTRNAQPDECVYAVSIDECAACGAYSIAPNRYRILLGGLCTLTSPFANGEPRGNRFNERDTPYNL